MKVHVISPKDNWILQIIAEELLKAEGVDFTNSQEINYDADLNYFINWCYWKILYPNLDKPKKTLVWFTHLDERNEQYLDVLRTTDHIVAKSLHGRDVLMNLNMPIEDMNIHKIHVLGGMGTLPYLPYRKIKLGISGRPYKGGRKGEDIILKLGEDLDPKIFEFVFDSNKWDFVSMQIPHKNYKVKWSFKDFWKSIDYWLSPSYAEGGPMDVLNAAKCGIPIISRDIGFFKELKTDDDIMFTDYSNLLYQLELIQEQKLIKIARMEAHTWDNFREWHINLFKEINEE